MLKTKVYYKSREKGVQRTAQSIPGVYVYQKKVGEKMLLEECCCGYLNYFFSIMC